MKIRGFEDTINWYNQNAESYIKSIENYSIPEKDAFIALLPENGYVLDAGCAGGRDTKSFSDRGLKAIGIDLSPNFVKKAKQKYPNSDFVEGNFLSLPFEDKSFDGVWSNASILHFETIDDVKSALKEFNRVLKDNGTLFVKVKAQTGTDKTAIVYDSLSRHKRFFRFFTQEEILQLIKESGFENIESKQYPSRGRPEVEWIYSLSKKTLK